ncbi:hypothetical protein Tco_0262549 [Tanacetum coccineum]
MLKLKHSSLSECNAPMNNLRQLTTTNHVFKANHRMYSNQTWMKAPMLRLSLSCQHCHPLEMHHEEHLASDAETEFMTIHHVSSVHLTPKPKMFPTEKNEFAKSTLFKEKSIAFLQSEKEKILSEKKDLAVSYLDEIVCLKNANKVARDMLQRFNMPTQTIPMLSKKPKAATADLHKDLLGTRNPGLGYIAKRAQPVLYDADTLLHPAHHPVRIWDSEDVLVHQVVSMKKMSEKPGHVRPANGFYDKLNAMMFVPQKELSQEQAYWLSANEIASNASNPATPVTPFVHNRPPPSQVLFHLQKVNAVFHQFEGIINERTTQKPLYVSEWCFDYAKQFVEQQLVPFYDHFKKHIESANETIFKEVKEYEQIFDDLDAEYERCVLDNKNLTIEKKNLLIKNDCLIAECLEKDICSIVLTSDIVVPPSSNCLCEDLRSACDREHTKVLELEAEVLKQQKMVIESEKRNSHLQKTHIDLQLKFQNYKQCIDTSSASNAIFEINKLRKQLQGKDDTIRNLDAQINIMKVLNVGSTEGSCDQQALETDRIQLKDTITSLRIQLDGLKVENVSLKRRYDELSKANTHSRTAYTEKLSALTTQHTKLQAQVTGKTSSGPSTSETPKVLAPGMYNLGSKYIPPPKRANWVKPTPLPKKKQVTFSEPPRPSLKPTQKPVVHPNKQTNVCVPMSTGVKPTSGASKPVPKRALQNHSSLPAKSANARRVEAHHRTLNKKNRVDSNLLVKHSVSVSNLNNVCDACNKSLVFANHNDCLVMCDDSVNVKTHQKGLLVVFEASVGNPLDDIFCVLLIIPLSRSNKDVLLLISELLKDLDRTNRLYKFMTDCRIIPVWYYEGLVSIASLDIVLFHLTHTCGGD